MVKRANNRLGRFYPKFLAKKNAVRAAVNIVDKETEGDVGGRDVLEPWESRFPAAEEQDEQKGSTEELYNMPRQAEIGQELTQLTTEREHGKDRQKLTEPFRSNESYSDANRFEDPDLKLGESENDDTDPLALPTYPPYTDGLSSLDSRYEDADKNRYDIVLHAAAGSGEEDSDGGTDGEHQLWICVDLDGTILESPEEYQDSSGNHVFGEILPGKRREFGPREALIELVEGGARVSIYTARQYFEDDADKLIDQLNVHLDNNGIPYSDIYIGKKPPAHFFVDDRTIPPFEGDWDLVMDAVRDKLKRKEAKVEKSADDEVKDVKNIHGIEFHVEWPKGSIRSYDGDDTYVTHMKADYGYAYGVEGTDGDQLDIYYSGEETDKAFVLEQVKEDGSYDEDKIMLGFESEGEAVDMFLQHMPAFMLGNIREVPIDKLVDALDPKTDPEDRRDQEDLVPSEELNKTAGWLEDHNRRMLKGLTPEEREADLNRRIKNLRKRKTDPYEPDPDAHLSDIEWLEKRQKNRSKAGFKFMAGKQPGEKVGLFIPVPDDLAKQYPPEGKAGEDDSAPHLTLLYIGSVEPERFDELKQIVEEELKGVRPFELTLGHVDVFINHEDQAIFHSTIKDVAGTGMAEIHDSVRKRLLDAGFTIKHASRSFKAHITLEYVNPGEEPKFSDVEPEGSWLVDEIEIWGLGDPYIIPLEKMTSENAKSDKESTKVWPGDDVFDNLYTDSTEDRENRDISRDPATEDMKYRNI